MSVFMVILAVGVIIPLASLLLSFVFDGIESVFHIVGLADSVDFGGDAGFMLLPMSSSAWCAAAIVLGGVGETLARFSGLSVYWVWGISAMSGYMIALLIHNGIVIPLKRAKNYTSDENSLVHKEAEVQEVILKGRVGAVIIVGTGGTIIYPAVSEDGEAIEQNAIVEVVTFSGGRAVVKRVGKQGGNASLTVAKPETAN